MLAMSTPLSSPAFLLVLASCFGFSGAVCFGCLENDVHLPWCWYSTDQPITGTDTNGQLGISSISSINSPDCPVGPELLSPLSSTNQQQWTESTAISQSSLHNTCKLCGKVFKNSRGVSIHTARMHRSSSSATSVPVPLPTCTDMADVAGGGAAAVRLITPSGEGDRKSAALTVTTDCNSQFKVQLQSQQTMTLNADLGSGPSRVTTRSANHATAAGPNPATRLVCLCGKPCSGRVGLSSHQRQCQVFNRLLLNPIVPNQQTELTIQTSLTVNSTTIDPIDSLENNSEHNSLKSNVADLKLQTNNLDTSPLSQSNNENHDLIINNNNNYLTADRLDTENLVFYFKSDLPDDRINCEVDCAGLVNHRIAVNRPPPPHLKSVYP